LLDDRRMIEGFGAGSGSGSIPLTNGFGSGSGRPKKSGSGGSGFGSGTLEKGYGALIMKVSFLTYCMTLYTIPSTYPSISF
jgi:hypothetical protein